MKLLSKYLGLAFFFVHTFEDKYRMIDSKINSSLVKHKNKQPSSVPNFLSICDVALGGPQTLAAGSGVVMERYVGAFTCPKSGRWDFFWQLVCSHSTWLQSTPPWDKAACKQQNIHHSYLRHENINRCMQTLYGIDLMYAHGCFFYHILVRHIPYLAFLWFDVFSVVSW